MSSRPWLTQYPAGVPAEIAMDGRTTLVDMLETAFHRYAQRDAAASMGSRLRFADMDRLSRDLGAWLQSLGLARGARVALMMPNLPQYMVAIAAVLRAGCVVVNVNPLYTPRELEHQLVDSGAEAIVVLENFAGTLEEVIDRTSVRHVVLAGMGDLLGFWKGPLVTFAVRHLRKLVPEFRLPQGDGRSVTRFNAACANGSSMNLRRVDLGPDDVAFLQYTGGTTGLSKGATLLHRNVVANILQTEAWFQPVLAKLGTTPMTIVCALPLYHIFALTICYLLGARLGAMNVLIANPRDIPGLVKTLSRHRVNMFPAVNTLFNALANDPRSLDSIFQTSSSPTAEAWRCRRRRRNNGCGSRVALSWKATACRRPHPSPHPTPSTTQRSPGRSGYPYRLPKSPSVTTMVRRYLPDTR